MIKRIAMLVVVFTLSLPAPASAAEGGIIEGRLINGTANGSSTAVDQEITLDTHLNDAHVSFTTTKTDAEGEFAFDSLNIDPGYSYLVTLTFQEAEYSSEWLIFVEGETTKSTEITVYDSITSNTAIKAELSHTIISVEPNSLLVVEYFKFINEADLTYIGSKEVTAEGNRETLRFSLPEEATELQYMMGLTEHHVFTSEDGFVDTVSVLPGYKEVAYSYRVNYNAGAYEFARRINYPTDISNLLVQGEGTEVISSQLTTEGLVDIESSLFNHLSGGNFAPGEILVAQLSGLPKSNEQGAFIWVSLTLIVLAAGVTFSYLIRRKRLQSISPVESYKQSQQRLLVELAQLDDDFEAGKIQEENYRRLRSVKKAQVIELTQRPKDKSGSG